MAVTEAVEIGGRRVTFPVTVRRSVARSVAYLVPAGAARDLLAPTGLRVLEPVPGRAVLSLAFVRYLDGDLDAYDEVAMALLVRPHAAPPAGPLGGLADLARQRAGAYIHRLPVNRSFTLEAGREIWGYPKFLADIEIAAGRGRSVCTLAAEGRHVLTLAVRDGGPLRPAAPHAPTYSHRDGVLRRTPWEVRWQGARGRLGGAEITLGDHPMAEELRSLGLPRRAVLSTGVANQRARFGPPEVVVPVGPP